MQREYAKRVIFGTSGALGVVVPSPAPTPDTPVDPSRGRPSSGWRWYAGWTIALTFALALTLAWCVALVWLVGRLASLVGL